MQIEIWIQRIKKHEVLKYYQDLFYVFKSLTWKIQKDSYT
jgi:hypothetical protein